MFNKILWNKNVFKRVWVIVFINILNKFFIYRKKIKILSMYLCMYSLNNIIKLLMVIELLGLY